MVILILSERIKKGIKTLEYERKILVINYELQCKLMEGNKTCSATAEEEQKKLFIKFHKQCDTLEKEVNFHFIKYSFMKFSSILITNFMWPFILQYDKWLHIAKNLKTRAGEM